MLDLKDKRIIRELENNSRQSLSQIGRKVGLSEQVVSYRLNSLMKREVISGFYTVIDIEKLGYTSYRTMFKLSNADSEKIQTIVESIGRNSNVLWVCECGGRWDLIVNIMAKNIIHYNEIVRRMVKKFPKQLQNYDTLTTLKVFQFERQYLVKKKDGNKAPGFGGGSKKIVLNSTDLKILEILSETARASTLEISRKANIVANTVVKRIKNLTKQGIIQGYKPCLRIEKAGYQAHKLLLRLHNFTDQREKSLLSFALQNPNISAFIGVVGAWNAELEIETKTKEEMREISMQVRDFFRDIVQETETVPLYRSYRYNYFPKDLLRECLNAQRKHT